MDEDQPPPDGNPVWPQPNQASQAQYVEDSAEPSSSVPTTSTNVTYSSLTAVPPFSQSPYRAHGYQNEQDMRHSFPGAYEISGSHGEVYQASHSSYERISPADDYRDVSSMSDGITSYSALADGANFATPQPVDSSTLSQSGYQVHQLVVDSENRVLAVQRVISPADCTVTQSAVGLHRRDSGSEAVQSTSMLQPVSSMSRHHLVPSASATSYSSQSEVTTSGGSPMSQDQNEPMMEQDVDQSVSSISGSISEGVMVEVQSKERGLRHLHAMEVLPGEPDTTQDDSQDYDPPGARSYMNEAANLAEAEPVLHSTMMLTQSRALSTSNEVMDSCTRVHPTPSEVMESSIESSGLSSSSHLTVSSHLVQPSAHYLAAASLSSSQLSSTQMSSSEDAGLDVTMDRTVDSSAMVAHIGHGTIHIGGYVIADAALNSTLNSDPRLSFVSRDNEPTTSDGPNTSYEPSTSTGIRKSNRLAEMENEIPSWHKPKYMPTEYNPNHIWCDECMCSYEGECPQHKLQICPDRIVFSRAWASLPLALQIFRLGESTSNELGVFAKKTIPKFTQFGPFVAELADSQEKLTSTRFLLMAERGEEGRFFYETSDENKCNWMMFVRPADTYAEQNLVAYQHGQDIYFSATCNIDPKAELKVWYAAHYASRLGYKTLEPTQEDIEALDQQECKFPCYECPKRFRTSAALQNHLSEHDNVGHPRQKSEGDRATQTRKKRSTAIQNIVRRKNLPPKKIKDMTTAESPNPATYHWKKRSTNIYLNKTLKKYQKRHDSEAIRRTIQSLYKKQTGKETGGNEWLCTHCDLTFDNSNLLNLHTLTHAAEDVGLDEIKKFAYQPAPNENGQNPEMPGTSGEGSNVVSLEVSLACPVCHMTFSNKMDLIRHAAEHGKSKTEFVSSLRPHKCDQCWKSFTTLERLQRHLFCHGDEDSKPLQCQVCYKRFMNNSALACHMKTHSERKYYECPICHMDFDQTQTMREHSLVHTDEQGLFPCPDCDKKFAEFLVLKKHIRGLHTKKNFPCPECNKNFPRPDKLKLHRLRHSAIRDFMCENCGRQFKRKDKLKEHIKRMHSSEREARDAARAERPPCKKFIPKVSPSDYHRFIYKCHTCLLGFKRRGMLVNHLAKKHPDVTPDSVPELNLPILKTQRDYYCQYCDKVYKSSSKRKSHIIKNHPGAELPLSGRKKSVIEEMPGVPNATYSQTVGSITTMPQSCEFCHKQYASKAKLMQHLRKTHPGTVPPAPKRQRPHTRDLLSKEELELQGQQPHTSTIHVIERYEPDGTLQPGTVQAADSIQAADLLTQAMSELTQSLQEYRQNSDGTYQLSARLHGTPTMVQIQTPGGAIQGAHSIDLSHLGQSLAHFAPNQGPMPVQVTVSTAGAVPGIQTQNAQHVIVAEQVPQPQSPQEGTSTSQAQTINLHPVNLVSNGNYIPRTWTNYTNYR